VQSKGFGVLAVSCPLLTLFLGWRALELVADGVPYLASPAADVYSAGLILLSILSPGRTLKLLRADAPSENGSTLPSPHSLALRRLLNNTPHQRIVPRFQVTSPLPELQQRCCQPLRPRRRLASQPGAPARDPSAPQWAGRGSRLACSPWLRLLYCDVSWGTSKANGAPRTLR
jgi:hypothetical protein